MVYLDVDFRIQRHCTRRKLKVKPACRQAGVISQKRKRKEGAIDVNLDYSHDRENSQGFQLLLPRRDYFGKLGS